MFYPPTPSDNLTADCETDQSMDEWINYYKTSEVLLGIKIIIVWDVTPCSLLKIFQSQSTRAMSWITVIFIVKNLPEPEYTSHVLDHSNLHSHHHENLKPSHFSNQASYK
jgi:hypothetical protein